MKLHDLKQQHAAALDKAESFLKSAEATGRNLNPAETENMNAAIAEATSLSAQIKASEKLTTLRVENGMIIPGGNGPIDAPGFTGSDSRSQLAANRNVNPEYTGALVSFLRSGGKAHNGDLSVGADAVGGFVVPGSAAWTRQRLANGRPAMNANTYEGSQGSSDAAGGYAISVPTVPQITPLALPDMGIYDASLLLETATDVKIPSQASFGTSAIKAESNGTLATFGGSDPTLGQTLLSAFMVGALRWVSWELLQDAAAFQQFAVEDLLNGQRIFEGALLASGTGSGQPLGVFGNTGTGTGSPYELVGTSADGLTLLNSLMDVGATLKAAYQPNASWIMSRATALAIRKAQLQANLYIPIVTSGPDGTVSILDRPVYFDANAPSLPTTTNAGVTPILFGDFKAGYIIGLRGGAGVNVKILDQPMAAQGQLGILAYRRLDARIRRSEAIQSIEVSHS